jgi:hypothetical protein
LVVEKLNMVCDGVHLRGKDDILETSFDGICWSRWSGCGAHGCRVGISFRNRQ